MAVAILAACPGMQTSQSGAPPGPERVRADASQAEAIVETFVLTPIRMECADMEVPAQVLGPVRNNSCGDWSARTEACYLPGRTLANSESPATAGMASLLERHLSAWVGAWRGGAWPAAGQGIAYDLKRYSSLEHVWLARRIVVRETVAGAVLSGRDDPILQIERAVAGPGAELEIEVFDGVRDVHGYPRIVEY